MVNTMKYVIAIMSLLMSGVLSADEQLVVLSVPGMKCPACPVTVMVALKRVKGVKSVHADFENKLVEATYDDQLTNISNLQVATKNAGFPSQVINDK
jgi:periplasmic mercuric ion binding protein